MVVWKYDLTPGDVVAIEMPVGAEVLLVGTQFDRPQMWARVDPDAPKETRRFRFAGTGHPLGERVGKHVGSFLMMKDALVFHVFEMR